MRSIAILLILAAACGDDSSGDDTGPGGTDPKLVTGGGVTGAAIDGQLHVHVIDATTGAPIKGAAVTVGSEATTSDAGLATFADVKGAQTVSATASGYAASTWVGVGNVNVTIPLQPSAALPTAHVTGTLNLPTPSGLGKYTLAVVLYSFLDDPSAPENSIPQPSNAMGVPRNTCVKTNSEACNWELTTRIGKQVHTVVLLDGDSKLTQSQDDDTYTLIGYAVGSPMTLTAGQQVTNETLTMVTATNQLAVTVPAALPGLPYIAAVPELSIPDVGRIVFPLPQLKASGTARILANTGALAGDYEVVAIATPSATAKAPFSATFAHKASGTAGLPAWMPAPTPAFSAGMFTVGPASGAAFHSAQLTQGTKVLWSFTLLGNPAAFALPTLRTDPLAGITGAVTYSFSAADVPSFNAQDFTVPNAKAALVRASGAEGTFTR